MNFNYNTNSCNKIMLINYRYAIALLERELSVLQLVKAMLFYETDEKKVDRERIGINIQKLKLDLMSAENDYKKIESERPPAYRKKDQFDRVTKEAEFKER